MSRSSSAVAVAPMEREEVRRAGELPVLELGLRDSGAEVDIPERRRFLLVRLAPREHTLLEFMLRHGGDLVSRRDLLREVFGYDFEPGTNLVEVHISHLRRKIAGSGVEIETVRGFGYRLRIGDDSDG